jgi:hypothetical protein
MHGNVKIRDGKIKALCDLTNHLLHRPVFLIGKDDVVLGPPRDSFDYGI